MKYLIVNGDDLGASPGINRGILEAHHRGILTSASLMVNAAGARDAADLSRSAPRLSVGLHADITLPSAETGAAAPQEDTWRAELDSQLARFQELMGRPPTHLDSHHNVHRDPRLLPVFLECAGRHRLPLREHSPVRYFSKFYGQWGGRTHLEQISVANLDRMLAAEIGEGFTELSCHPGYVEDDFASGYLRERRAEVQTLCEPGARRLLDLYGIRLISYHDLPGLLKDRPAPGALTAA